MQIDKDGDGQISMEEFEQHVNKINAKEDKEAVMKEFIQMDTNQDGYIQFIEFLRASCMKQNIVLPDKLSIYDMLRIGEIIDYNHIT